MQNVTYSYEIIPLHIVTASSITFADNLEASPLRYWSWQRFITQTCIYTDSTLTMLFLHLRTALR